VIHQSSLRFVVKRLDVVAAFQGSVLRSMSVGPWQSIQAGCSQVPKHLVL
jgi:hypothetical protein